jgi:acyl-CoA thioester hydrolase
MNPHKTFEYQVMIKEFHLDSFGHVNNAVYLQLYEEARWNFITKNGFGLEVIQAQQKGPVILDLQVKFRREVKNREIVTVYSQTAQILNSKMMILEQKMFKADGKLASEALFTIGFFDMRERKLIDAGPDWLKAVGISTP